MTESLLPGASGSSNPNRKFSFPVDQIGVWTSTLCVIHCLFAPVVLSLSAVSAHFLPSEERTHRTLAIVIAALGAIALVKGYRMHGPSRVLWLMLVGLGFIFGGAWWGDRLPSHGAEVFVTLVGSGFMIAAHRINHTFCRDCSCSHSK
ncbi:MAG: MerC domain-containing protein [Terracidiphilus sp.]